MKGIKFKIFFVSFCTCLTVAIIMLVNIAVTKGTFLKPPLFSVSAGNMSGQNTNNTENTETTNREETQNTTTQETENSTVPTEESKTPAQPGTTAPTMPKQTEPKQESTQPATENKKEPPTSEAKEKPFSEMTLSEILAPNQINAEHPGITENGYKNRIQYFSDIFPGKKEIHEIKGMDIYFVGDSLMEDWADYRYLPEKVFCSVGADTYKITRQNLIEQPDGEKITVQQAIGITKPKILIIMLGSNDVEWMEGKKFNNFYNKFLNAIEEESPDTKIYLQSITPIRSNKSNEWYNNERVNYFNLLIANIAKTRGYRYIDIAQYLKGSDGQLRQEFNGGDGIHLSPSAYNVWMDYYKTHI